MNKSISHHLISRSGKVDRERKYWLTQLSGELVISCFPYDDNTAEQAGNEIERKRMNFRVQNGMYLKLNRLANRSSINLFSILTTCLTILLAKYTGNQDILIAAPIYKQDVEGEFLNTVLVLRNRVMEEMSFKNLLIQVKNTVMEADEHLNYPIDTLLPLLNISAPPGSGSLYETAILLENIHNKAYVEEVNPNILFSFLKTKNSVEGILEYNRRLYRKVTIEGIIRHFLNLLTRGIENIEQSIGDMDILSGEERRQLLLDFNNTETCYPAEKTVIQLFEDQVERIPLLSALVYMDMTQTFRNVNKKANQLARVIRRTGVDPGSIVGIMTDPGIEMVLAILAVLKAGSAYLPLSSDFPSNRIKYIVKDSGLRLILTGKKASTAFNDGEESLDISEKRIYTGKKTNPVRISRPDDLVYTVYTSGTTGNPKGVLVENRNLLNYITWFVKITGLTGKDKGMFISSFAFDLGYTTLYSTLLQGCELHLVPKDLYLSPGKLSKDIKKKEITFIKTTPSFLSILVNSPGSSIEAWQTLRLLVLGGEEINVKDVKRVHTMANHIRVMNHYGPTEATIGAVARFIDFNRYDEYIENPTLGRPINNTRVYILDKKSNPLPVGAAGELCISGAGLARGYLNHPLLTREKFIPHPLIPGEKLYRTGDRARWQPDGNVEFLGRLDQQVKITGFRIEPAEIENRLLAFAPVKEAVVDVRQSSLGGKRLVAYIIPDPQAHRTGNSPGHFIEDLKNYLKENLPVYMIPSAFMLLEQFPLTLNGKVDVKALPEPGIKPEKIYAPPRDEIEKKLVTIWGEVLGVEKGIIGIDCNFFDLGGDSLKATIMTARVHDELNLNLSLTEVFRTPFIRDLSRNLSALILENRDSIEPTEKKDHYPLSSAQKRLYMLQQMDLNSTVFNTPKIAGLEGKLDRENFEKSLGKLIKRHEILRCSFGLLDEEPYQRIHQNPNLKVDYFESSEENKENIIKNFSKPFDLNKVPLLRTGLIKIAGNRYIFMVDMHHIITDGISYTIFFKEFMFLYQGKTLDSLKIQYRDYAEWQNREKQKKALKKQEEFWIKHFADNIPILNLTPDYPRPSVQSFEGDRVYFFIDPGKTANLKKLAKNENVTLFILLLVIYNILLYKLSGEGDIVIGTPLAGRRHAVLEHLIGIFLNTLALRNFPEGQKTFRDFLHEVEKSTLAAFDHQDYPFEDLVGKVIKNRDISRNPLYDTMLIFSNFDLLKEEISGLTLTQHIYEKKASNNDLVLYAYEKGETLSCALEYCTKLFKKSTIERFIQYFRQVITTALNNPGEKISAIEIISGEEKQRLIKDFNNNNVDFPIKPLYELFQEQVEKKCASTAVVFEQEKITYEELNKRANQLARVLRNYGLQREQVVAILMKRSPEMVGAVLAVWKAGGGYLPIDPAAPMLRTTWMLRNAGAKFLISTPGNSDAQWEKEFKNRLINPEDMQTLIKDQEKTNLNLETDTSQLAYVIYTSGSTGKPKGVMIEHIGMMNHINAKLRDLQITGKSIIAQNSSHTFDISIWQFFAGLSTGGTTVIYPDPMILNPGKFLLQIVKDSITILEVVPSYLSVILDFLDNRYYPMHCLEYLLVTGEILKSNLVKSWFEKYPAIKMVNAYGPTEASDDITHFIMDKAPKPENERIPIGKTLQNLNIYIVDRDGNLCPAGIKGDIRVSGPGVGRGYLNDPQKTNRMFIRDSFPGKPNGRLYKTGDLGAWKPDGVIDFWGRTDDQVKIRGFRIEVGEIETLLLEYPKIRDAVVVNHQDAQGNQYLCAYFEIKQEINPPDIKAYLSDRLPGYMVPDYFMPLDKIPLTPNGKIDKEALPSPEIKPGNGYMEPAGEIETKLVELWSDVLDLGKNQIGVNHSFFELGGHSLKVMVLTARIHRLFNVKIPLAEIFKTPTIREIASFIKAGRGIVHKGLNTNEEQEVIII